MGHKYAFEKSVLGGKTNQPLVEDLKTANDLVKKTKKAKPIKLVFKPGLDIAKCLHIGVHDSSFNNLPKKQIPEGKF